MTVKLKYGNTNTYYIPGRGGGLLVDTDYAGTLGAFYRALKQKGLGLTDIAWVMATHYHPDHMGLIPQLMDQGVKLLLVEGQEAGLHFSDRIFAREGRAFQPIRQEAATRISPAESRRFLERLGIAGEILPTPSHSPDSVSLLLDDGDCLVGDLEPLEYLAGYGENLPLRRDWDAILSHRPRRILYGHVNEKLL